MPDFGDLWKQVSTVGDGATLILGSVAGWAVDVGLNLHGVPSPGAVGVVSGAFALGTKKTIDVQRSKRKPLRRAQSALSLFGLKNFKPSNVDLEQELDLYRRQIIDDKALNRAIDRAIKEYRQRS
jgi:hypothetical protein